MNAPSSNVKFYGDSEDDYEYWKAREPRIFKKINDLIKDIRRDPYSGIGKPEPLKQNLSGW